MNRAPYLAFELYHFNRVQVVRKIRLYFKQTGNAEPLLAQLPEVMVVIRRSGTRLYNAVPLACALLDLLSPWRHDERYRTFYCDFCLWLLDNAPIRFRLSGRGGSRVKPLRR